MTTVTELDVWHIQCIKPRLKTDEDREEYVDDVKRFIRALWKSRKASSGTDQVPPQLDVAQAENCTMTYRNTSTNTVRLRFKLPGKLPENDQDRDDQEDTFCSAVSYFCSAIFDLKAHGEVEAKLGLITNRSLLGIRPLSPWFEFYWTQGFLDTFVRKKVPIFNDIAGVGFFTPWVRAISLLAVAVGDKGGAVEVSKAISLAIRNSFNFETREPDEELRRTSIDRSKRFFCKVEQMLGFVRAASQACVVQRQLRKSRLPSDVEIGLFKTILEVLEIGFDALTVNGEVFQQWQEIIASAQNNLKTSGVATVGSLGFAVFGIGQACVGAAYSGTSVAGAAGAALCSAAVLCPLALFVFSACIYTGHYLLHQKAKKSADEFKMMSEDLAGQYRAIQRLAQWLVMYSNKQVSSEEDLASEAQDMKDLRAHLTSHGLGQNSSLADYQATLDKELEVLCKGLKEMKENPSMQHLFT